MNHVSIIHGARGILESRHSRPHWPATFGKYLLDQGDAEIFPFYWSGGVGDLLEGGVIKAYASHLVSLCANINDSGSLSIFAKSIGAVIAECALRQIFLDATSKLSVSRLVRVGCPDSRKHIAIPLVNSIVDISSTDDLLCKTSKYPVSGALAYFLRPALTSPLPVQKIKIRGLSHQGMNVNCSITDSFMEKSSLFELYRNALFQARSHDTDPQSVRSIAEKCSSGNINNIMLLSKNTAKGNQNRKQVEKNNDVSITVL